MTTDHKHSLILLKNRIQILSESLPILELIEECFPKSKSLLPEYSIEKHRVRQICEIINSGMQPLQSLGNLRVRNFIFKF